MRRLLVPLALLVLAALAATGCAAGPSSAPAGDDREPSVLSAATTLSPSVSPTTHPVRPTGFHMWKFDAPIVPLRPSGRELVPPADPSVLGWWGKPAGARTGTTLLTGHTVHTGGGELDDLELTPVGSTARVSGVDYRVVSVRIISKAELARRAPQLFSQDGAPTLVVVTCEGYDRSTGAYHDNVVVTAEPVAAHPATQDG